MSEELDILKEVAEKLNGTSNPYMISGSVAMNFYAEPRMTRDIDIVIVLKMSDVKMFVALFREGYYIEEETVVGEVARKGMFNIINNRFVIKIDFILQKGGVFDAVRFERRKQIEIEGVKMWIISPEDLILSKLLWAKESRSEMQLKDVKNLSQIVGLDNAYVLSWVSRLGLGEIFDMVKG